MRPSANRWLDCAIVSSILAALSIAYFSTLAPGPTWANNGADSGDLITAAATLGVAHPTGYPTYLLFAHLFQLIPLGDLAFRTNLFSATTALLAVLCVYAIVRELHENQDWTSWVAAGIAALAFGLSPVFWSQALVAEVHTLNALFTALILLFIQRATRGCISANRWTLWLQRLTVGLALGNHVTIALAAAVWLIAAAVHVPRRARLWWLAQQLGRVAAGLLVYLYLPLRAATRPPVNWGSPDVLAGFWWVISGQPYHALALGVPPVFLYGRLEAWANLLVEQFGGLLVLGFLGLIYGAAHSRQFVWLTALMAATYVDIPPLEAVVAANRMRSQTCWVDLNRRHQLDCTAP